jgi:guanylate kinase
MKYVFTFVGPSCAGKSTLTERMVREHPDHFGMITNYTSRPKRPSEAGKSDYVHVNAETVLKLRDCGLLLNYVEYAGVHYGLDAVNARQLMDSGRSPVVTVEPSGVVQLKEALSHLPDVRVVCVCVNPPREVVVRRWLDRAVEGGDLDFITRRLIKTFDDEFDWINSLSADIHLLDQNPNQIDALISGLIRLREGLCFVSDIEMALNPPPKVAAA